MKILNRTLSILLSVIMILSIIPLTAGAAEYTGECGKNLTWLLDTDTGVLTISGTGAMDDSASLPGYSHWYYYRDLLTSVCIEDGVTSIGYNAFNRCDELKSVIIPDSVVKIEGRAFYGCSKLEKISIGNGMEKISNYAIPENVLLFYSGTKAQWYAIEENSGYSFSKYGYLVHCSDGAIVSPSGNCGENLTWGFDMVTGILTISGEGVMENYTASNQPWSAYKVHIKKVLVEKGITTVGNYAFYNCINLTEVIIPDSVTEIGSYSLYGCNRLNITIPASVEEIAPCFALEYTTKINYTGTSTEWLTLRDSNSKSELNMYLVNCQDKTLYPSDTCGENVMWEMNPETNCMTISGFGAMNDYDIYMGFQGVWEYFIDDIHTVVIKDGVESIGKYAFSYCPNLMSVSIPESVIKIGADAFFACEKLKDLALPEGVIEIGSSAFAGCYMLKNITIPASVTTIGAGAFAAPESIFVAQGNQYYSSDENGVLFNKDKSVLMQYPSNSPKEYYEIPENVKIINDGAFLNSKNLKSISISENVVSIGASAFQNCANLERIKIPDGITTIPNSAFAFCSNLKSVFVPGSATVIGDYAFEFCGKLENVNISDGVKTIGKYAFGWCDNLKEIVIPDSVTSIDMFAFYLSGVSEVVLGKGLTEITDGAFYSCSSLREIVIPENVTTIGANAFDGTRLVEVWIPDSVVQIEDGAFDLYSDKIKDIYYMGTKQQWEKIKITDRYDDFSEAKIHYSCRATQTNPSCTERGEITYICDCCDAIAFGGYVEPKGHEYTVVEVPATCTKHGVTNYTCEVCESSYWEYSANPTGHTLNEDGVCETCGEKEVSVNHINTQKLTIESVFAMIMNLILKLLGIFSVA